VDAVCDDHRHARRASVSPLTGTAALARNVCQRPERCADSGRGARAPSRESPPRMSAAPEACAAGIMPPGEHHVGAEEAAAVAVLQEERPVRIHEVIGWRPSEGEVISVIPCSVPSISMKTPTGVSIDGDNDILVRKFLAVLLVPEPHVKGELAKYRTSISAVADDRFELLPHLHDRRLHGAFVRQSALSVFHAHAEHTSLATQLLVFGVEEGVPPAVAGRASGWHRVAMTASRASSAELNRSLISRSRMVVFIEHCSLSSPLHALRRKRRIRLPETKIRETTTSQPET